MGQRRRYTEHLSGCVAERAQGDWRVPPGHARPCSLDENEPTPGRHLSPAGGGCEVFAIGTRVVLIRPRGVFDLLRWWSVIECACDLCDRGQVPLNEWIGCGWRHEPAGCLRVYGSPAANDFRAP